MEKISVTSIRKKKKSKEPITALTCYDHATARLIDEGGVDMALVGDSLANTRLGYANTLPVTVDEMLHHVRASARGIRRSLLVADMPFQSYEWAPWQAAQSAGRFVKEGGAQAVKVEGGKRIIDSIKAILKANIPVVGHIGLTPQAYNKEGGYFVHGKSPSEGKKLLQEARLLEKTGVFCLVLEGIPAILGKKITKSLNIPTIGIGAGPHCDGQILVLDDMLGITEGHPPKFVKKYASLRQSMMRAVHSFTSDVSSRRFPTKSQSY